MNLVVAGLDRAVYLDKIVVTHGMIISNTLVLCSGHLAEASLTVNLARKEFARCNGDVQYLGRVVKQGLQRFSFLGLVRYYQNFCKK